ncbi:unnamed protein product [Moneuplotes crassus]|uniref:Uncharacterized protein n=1 Tax=Euplotes crassus TaxID=5936 RepID=A0AAD1UPJ0_EUPCR|nr:unnamed protein product [Moneuplotes crassus]
MEESLEQSCLRKERIINNDSVNSINIRYCRGIFQVRNQIMKYYLERMARKQADYSLLHPSFKSCNQYVSLKQGRIGSFRVLKEILKRKLYHLRPISCGNLLKKGAKNTSQKLALLCNLKGFLMLRIQDISEFMFKKIVITCQHVKELHFVGGTIFGIKGKNSFKPLPNIVQLSVDTLKFSLGFKKDKEKYDLDLVNFVLEMVSTSGSGQSFKKLKKVIFSMIRIRMQDVKKIMEIRDVAPSVEVRIENGPNLYVFRKSQDGVVEFKEYDNS